MARKRMISPEIWESSSFSKLSDFAKLIFIGLISNADDSGKGKANPGYIRSKLFPNDEDRRVTDIKKALSEIALTMSITFYEVEGDNFYLLTNWARWQKIDRPTPSKIPDPPADSNSVGGRGRYTQNQEIGNNSTNIRRGFDEGSPSNRIEKNKNRIPPLPPKGGEGEREDARERFFSAYPKLRVLARLDDSKIDYNLLYERFAESEFLRTRYAAMWVYRNYEAIIQGTWRDEESAEEQTRRRAEWYRKRRERAEDVAEYWQRKAETIPGYNDLMKQKKTLEIASAKAAAEGNSQKVQETERALGQTVIKIHDLLKQNGIKKIDLNPKFKCPKCEDTGYLPDGRPCDCYEEEKGNAENK